MNKFFLICAFQLFATFSFSQKNDRLFGTWKFTHSINYVNYNGVTQKAKDDMHVIDTLFFEPNGVATIYQMDNKSSQDSTFNYSSGIWELLDNNIIISDRLAETKAQLPNTKFKLVKLSKTKLIIEFMNGLEKDIPEGSFRIKKHQEAFIKLK